MRSGNTTAVTQAIDGQRPDDRCAVGGCEAQDRGAICHRSEDERAICDGNEHRGAPGGAHDALDRGAVAPAVGFGDEPWHHAHDAEVGHGGIGQDLTGCEPVAIEPLPDAVKHERHERDADHDRQRELQVSERRGDRGAMGAAHDSAAR